MSRAAVVWASAALTASVVAAQGPVGRGGGGGAVPIKPGEECPPGTTLVRVGRCQAPQLPPPSIVDYRPESTLVVEQHSVPRAKFPVIDMHGHPPALTSPETVDAVVAAMDALNLRMMVVNDRTTPERLREGFAVTRGGRHQGRFAFFTSVDFRNVGPGFGQRAARQLEADVKAGAVGLGEIMKDFGLSARKTDGTRLKLDDPELDPIWQTAARLNIPVMIHTGDPQEFFEPIDARNERWLELALFPDRRFPEGQFPRFEELMAERDRLFRRHPKTKFIAAHLGWHANNLPRLARMFDEMPNLFAEVGAVLYDLGRQPRTARATFIKYQDRIMFGKDAYQPEEYPYFWRTFETADEYFDYYRGYHAFWKLYGMALPDEVLRKLYYQNALTLIPGLPRAGFPE